MMRLAKIFFTITMTVATVGCQGASSRSSILSPGTTKVPAPGTGAVGKPDQSYYNNGGAKGSTGLSQSSPAAEGPPVGTGVRAGSVAAAPTSSQPAANSAYGPQMGTNPWAGGVKPAAFTSESPSANGFAPGSTSLQSRLRGMPANDATQSPARNPNSGKPIEITDLPPPGSSPPPRRLQMSSGPATPLIESDEESASEADSPPPTRSTATSSAPSLNWKTRN